VAKGVLLIDSPADQGVGDLSVEVEELVAGDAVAFVVFADGYVEGGFSGGRKGQEHESEEWISHESPFLVGPLGPT